MKIIPAEPLRDLTIHIFLIFASTPFNGTLYFMQLTVLELRTTDIVISVEGKNGGD